MENANNTTNGSASAVSFDYFTDEQRARFKEICERISKVLGKYGGIFSSNEEIKEAASAMMMAQCVFFKKENQAAKVANIIFKFVNFEDMQEHIIDMAKLAYEVRCPDTISLKYMVPSILDNYARDMVKHMVTYDKTFTASGRNTMNELLKIKGNSYCVYKQIQTLASKQDSVKELYEQAQRSVGSFTKYLFRAVGSFVNSKLSFA